MDINAFTAAKAYGSAQQALKPDVRKPDAGNAGDNGFNPEKILGDMTSAIAKSESTASAYMVGKADPHSVVEALASAATARRA